MSFRLKTIIGIVAIEVILLLILIWNSLYLLGFTAEEQLQYRAKTTATLFATTTTNAVLSSDLASLESYVAELMKNPGLVYVRVSDNTRVLEEKGDPQALERLFQADTTLDQIDDGVFDTFATIRVADIDYGRVELGLDVAHLYQQFNHAKKRFFIIAGSEILLTTLFSLILGSFLTKQLKSLKEGTNAISEGRFGYQVVATGKDEIAEAVRAFNNMSAHLAKLMEENSQKNIKLQAAKDLLTGLIDNLPSGVLMTGPDGSILHANDIFFALLELSPQESGISLKLSQIFDQAARHFDEPERTRRHIMTVIKVGEPVRNLIFKMKNERYLEADYQPLFSNYFRYADLWHIRDVTERIIAQQQIQQRRKQLDTIFQLSPDGFVYFDSKDRLTSVNPAFCEMTGLAEHSLQHTAYPQFLNRLQEWCNGQIIKKDPDLLMKICGKKPMMLQMNERSLSNDLGQKIAHVMFFRDVTKEYELDQMKSDFLATAAHELRTPMTNIFGFTELLLHFDHDQVTRQEMLETIHSQSSYIVEMLNELLDLARIEARAGQDFDIQLQNPKSALLAVIDSYQSQSAKQRLHVIMPDRLPNLKFDHNKFQRVINNIVSNAFKYSKNDSEIILQVKEIANAVSIEVTDHGIGMTAEQVDKIFERFYRADKSCNIPGSGLGMSLVKEIVDIHGWTIDIASQLNNGTTVKLVIPIPDYSPLTQSQAENITNRAATK